jgi:molecular chaperone HtpG
MLTVRQMAPTNEKKVSNGSNYVYDDIVFYILSKLPLKSIKRFSCARKSWSRLFENPNFTKMFIINSHPLYHDACLNLSQSPEFPISHDLNNFYLLSGDKFQNKLKLNFPPPFLDPQFSIIRILDCVNGILRIIGKTVVVFWNPATEEVKVIPPSQLEFSCRIMDHGFGYDHVKDDYKIIQYVDVVEGHDPFWEIYSLKNDSWRKMDIDMPSRVNFDNVSLNGICHWLGEANDNYDIVVVSFHLGNEVCFVTPLPSLEEMDYDSDNVKLQVLNGSVVVIVNHIETKSFHISILGEIGVKESWVRLFDIGPLSCIMRPIIVWNKGNIIVRKDDQLACFDLTTGVIEEIGVKAEQFCHIFIYKKNLLPFGVIDN